MRQRKPSTWRNGGVRGRHGPGSRPRRPTADGVDLDGNGDGGQFGIAAAGPADDGAYYQAVVDAATELSEENGFEEPIVVDNIQAADAATAIGDLAQQDVDVIIVGASEIAEPLPQLIEEYPDIFWYCNCGAGFPEDPGLAQSIDNGAEISYTAGYATGLLLQDNGGDTVSFIGCCDLGFEKQAYMAFELGLQAVDPAYTMTYVPTGDFPFDFDNTANATAALQTAIDDGADAVYPYLGGAHRPVVQAANEAGLITMSAGSSKVCEDTEELDYDIAVKFDGGDYVRAVMVDIIDGNFQEGDIKAFKVGVDPEPGAVICDPTPEQQAAMDDVYAQIAAGDLDETFGADHRGGLRREADPKPMTSAHRAAGGRGAPPRPPSSCSASPSGSAESSPATTSTSRCDRGRVHGILGENGAGKSTLMKVLIGLVLPDAGQIRLDGEAVQIDDPIEAAEHGIAMVHQHFSLVEPLTVWENVALGDVGRLDPPPSAAGSARSASSTAWRSIPTSASPTCPPACASGSRSSSACAAIPQVLVFDEPTSVLTPAESEFLFDALRRVVDEEGKAVALVSHKLPEVLAATDEITIMRDGRVVDHRADGRRATPRHWPGRWSAATSRCAASGRAFGVRRRHADRRRSRRDQPIGRP